MTDSSIDARAYMQGWMTGWLAAGGSLSASGVPGMALRSYENAVDPPELPEPWRTRVHEAIEAQR